MTATDYLAADRARCERIIARLEKMRVKALRLGPAASEILESIDRDLATERRELEAHE